MKFITVLHGGVFPIYYNITMGGGGPRDPEFLLRNIWTAPYMYVAMISQRYVHIGCTSCFMCGADLITLITHLPHVACHIDTNPALNHGTITIAISK